MIEIDNDLKTRFLSVREQSLKLCAPLKPEDYVVQPVVDVSPPKWHLAHTTWFFEQFVLVPHCQGYAIYDEDYAFMFNSYYESVGKRVLRADRGNMTRPSTADIKSYRHYVDEHMAEFLSKNEIGADLAKVLELGLQHEQQHQELLVTDIKYILGHNPLFPVYDKIPYDQPDKAFEAKPNVVDVEEGIYEVGYDGNDFHFDNEEGLHKVFLHAYQIQDRLVTNKEFLEFMRDGGYEQFSFWLSEGWEWAKGLETKAPMYWHNLDGVWHRFTMNGLREVNPQDPVTHLSYFEADAFARWKGMRLPTEFEWEVAAKSALYVNKEAGNFVENEMYDTVYGDPSSNQMFGDAWEWTASAYLPYPNFKTVEGAIGEYNGKFMINQMVLRGGSCATPRNHIRSTYRNFWHPHLRWQFNGFRLAQNI